LIAAKDRGFAGSGKIQWYGHSEEPAGDEESRIVLKTFRAKSFTAAQDDSMGAFFRKLFGPQADEGSCACGKVFSPSLPSLPITIRGSVGGTARGAKTRVSD
jgi:hypothetical protein